MSEIKTLDVEVSFPDVLEVDVDFGQTLTKIVAPEHYMGPFEFYPSSEDQIIPVKEKMPVEDIVIPGIDFVGYSKAELVWDEVLETNTSQKYILTKQDGSDFSYDKLVVDFINYQSLGNTGWRTYWNKKSYGGNPTHGMIALRGDTYTNFYPCFHAEYTILHDEDLIRVIDFGKVQNSKATYGSVAHETTPDDFKEINMYGWWSREIPAGTRLLIKGYHKL